MPATTYRESPRLKDFDYEGPLAAHVVLVTRRRQPLFADPHLAQIATGALGKAAEKFSSTLHAYCFMPDHAHLLIEIPDGVSLERLVRWYKQITGFRLKQVTGAPAWQVSYFDHVLRHDEAIEDVARYVWNNPVLEGLVEDWTTYPFSGPRELMAGFGTPSQV